jgi:ATP-binding cassette subfamily B protein
VVSSENSNAKVDARQSNIIGLIARLAKHISRRRQYQFMLLLGLILASAFAEVVSLGAVLPFLAILTAPEKVLNYPGVAGVMQALGIVTAQDLALPLTLAFALAALAAGGIRVSLLWTSTRFANAVGADLSIQIYRRTLFQPYRVHVTRNSSAVISGITDKVGTATNLLTSLLTAISSAVLLVSIMLALLAIDAVVATSAAIGFGASYSLITRLSRRQLERNGQRIARESTHVIKALQEGLGGIRDVLLDGTQSVYSDIYRKADQPLRRARGDNAFLNQSPRHAMEALGMVLIASLAYYSFSGQSGAVGAALPVLGALALGAQRLLPALQQLYSSWANMTGNHASLVDALELLDQPLPANAGQPVPKALTFRDAIRFDDVRFRYSSDGPWVLDGINLIIPKGSRIGMVGSTGSGKSTALDLLMLLLEPTHGNIIVDNHIISGEYLREWQRTIAHVPQNIYLADTTLAENIAFGVPPDEIDLARVRQAASQAQIAEFIESRPQGYHAFVGERGIRLSGGQRQRIGIARALYKQATVLVFDEATSALDNATEKTVMDAINNLNRDLTLFIIAHRLTTVQHCDTIVQLERGRIVAQGTYEQLLEHSSSFRSMAISI